MPTLLAILFPISAFVACGFEHSVANMYFLPIGAALAAESLGGTLLVAFIYWWVYVKPTSHR